MSQDEYFAVIAKSQRKDGSYVPITTMGPTARAQHRESLETMPAATRRRYKLDSAFWSRGHFGDLRRFHGPAPEGRAAKDVWSMHGVAGGIEDALGETLRPSKVHPNVHYGSSVSPSLEKFTDTHLRPDLARRSKGAVAFHHGPITEGALAAAAPSHITNGHTSRIILNSHYISDRGQWQGPAKGSASGGVKVADTINHEFGHALRRGGNPWSFLGSDGELNAKRALGEEGRADAVGVAGEGNYQRKKAALREGHEWAYGSDKADAMWANYEHVHTRVKAARPDPTPLAPARGLKPGELKAGLLIGGGLGVAGAALGGKALYDHYHRDHSGRFAPGENQALRKN